jgi:Arylsulfotransferase (ASST)
MFERMDEAWSRRRFLAAGGVALAGLALPGKVWARAAAGGATDAFWTFRSAPGLNPPSLTVNVRNDPAPGLVFATTLNGPGQRGPLIFDDAGNVVWFRPLASKTDVILNFRPQVYLGKPVLTWWEGVVVNGVGQGYAFIVDSSYTTVARVAAGNGLKADPHEFLLTPQGTALLTAYKAVPADLSSVGGPVAGMVYDSIVQEVDVHSGQVLFEWHSLDHVPLTDSFAPAAPVSPFDYFHVNSIGVDLDGNLVVSARNTSAVYSLDRKTGAVRWRLGGRSSDFTLGPEAPFMWQHDARMHPDGTLTLYDDGPSASSPQSRAIRLGLDLGSMRADLLQAYPHPTPLLSTAMGNAQVLPGDAVFVGWGTEPYITEFAPTGEVRFDAMFTGGAWNYRAFRAPWTGTPASKPVVAVTKHGARLDVYASWNGSTETAYWRVEAGRSAASLAPVKTVPRLGFETRIQVPATAGLLSVSALDGARRVLATSRTVSL